MVLGLTAALALQAATQLWATDFEYQAALGRPFAGLYPPWSILIWANTWGHEYPDAVSRAVDAGLLTFCVGMVLAMAVKRLLSLRDPFLHGSARWASEEEAPARETLVGATTKVRVAIQRVSGQLLHTLQQQAGLVREDAGVSPDPSS